MTALTQRVKVGTYYTDGAALYEVVAVVTLGAVIIRDCVTANTREVGIDAFRRGYWLVGTGGS